MSQITHAGKLLMIPIKRYRGHDEMTISFTTQESSLGTILVAQSERGVCAILLGENPDQLIKPLQDKFPQAKPAGVDVRFARQVAQVVQWIEAPDTVLNLPLDIRGTAFQQRVWQALREIPLGTTVSYTDIALRIGSPTAARAVAGACAANMLSLVIPCHRVVRKSGALSGYRWGITRKRALLKKELMYRQ